MAPPINHALHELGTRSVDWSALAKVRPHPLGMLSVNEVNKACAVVKTKRATEHLWIRVCTLREPVCHAIQYTLSCTYNAFQGKS
jgi:Cu2+-containing amine oxidase